MSEPSDEETPGVERKEMGGTALALENARLRAELAQRERLGEVMASVVKAITSPRDQAKIMAEVVSLAGEAIGADASYIALLEDRAWKPVYLWRMPSGYEHKSIPLDQTPFAALALRDGRPVAVDDCRGDERVDRELQQTWGALMMAPMVVRDERLGGLFFHFRQGPHHFSKPEIAFAVAVRVRFHR